MREVAPGDIIFSFRDTRIAALGIARSYCYESPKPTEFGTAGSYWESIGWKIDVNFRELNNRIHPKSHIGELCGLLPKKYSPLRANGDGLQSVYLAEVGRPFAAALFRLIGGEANQVKDVAKEVDRAEQLSPSREPDLERWEERVEHDIREDTKIPDTQRQAIILARVMTVFVVRAFVKMRESLLVNAVLAREVAAPRSRVDLMDENTRKQFEQVFEAILGLSG